MKSDHEVVLIAKELAGVGGQAILDARQKYEGITEEQANHAVFIGSAMAYGSMCNFLGRDLHTATAMLMEVYRNIVEEDHEADQ